MQFQVYVCLIELARTGLLNPGTVDIFGPDHLLVVGRGDDGVGT